MASRWVMLWKHCMLTEANYHAVCWIILFITCLLLYPVDITHNINSNYYTMFSYADCDVTNLSKIYVVCVQTHRLWRPTGYKTVVNEMLILWKYILLCLTLFVNWKKILQKQHSIFMRTCDVAYYWHGYTIQCNAERKQRRGEGVTCDKKNLPWVVVWYDLYPTRCAFSIPSPRLGDRKHTTSWI